MPHNVDSQSLEDVLKYAAELIGAKMDDLEYKDISSGFKRVEDVESAKTVMVYISIPFGDNVTFGDWSMEISGDWLYKLEETYGNWNPTEGIEIKLIERKE